MPAKGPEKTSSAPGLLDLSYYSLFALVIITPLFFTKYIESSFDLAKKSALIVLGGVFIVFTILYLLTRTYKNTEESDIFIDKRFDPAVFLFLFAAFLSMVFSIKPYVSYQGQYIRSIGFITYLYLFLIYFLSSQLFRDKNKIDVVILLMELTGAAAAMYAFIQYAHIDPFDTPLNAGTRPVSTFGHNTFAAGFMVMVFPFSVIRIFRSAKPYTGLLLSLILAGGIIITQSRGAYAAALAVIIIILVCYPFTHKPDAVKFRKSLKINLFIIGVAAVVLMLLILLIPSNPFVNKLMSITELTKSSRWLLWRDSFVAYKLHPVTGSGIATFSSVFEYFISYQLKALEPKSYFDHAHNVFINTLVTMGAVGAAAYIIMLLVGIIFSAKAFFNNAIDMPGRLFFMAALTSLVGYCVYSMADFEDTSILLYLFLIFALVKEMYGCYYENSVISCAKAKNSFMYAGTVLSAGIILFCGYNMYVTWNNLEADSYYKSGIELYNKGDIQGSINELNKAVTKNFEGGTYKFTLSGYVREYCFKNPGLNIDAKNNLLHQAEEELGRAKLNFFSHLQYQASLSLIKFQMGETQEGEKLREKIFETDSLILNYRNDLARYYYSVNDPVKMLNEVNAVLAADPYNSDATLISASYYLSINNKQMALQVCENYLKKFPLDPNVISLKQEIIKQPEIKKAP